MPDPTAADPKELHALLVQSFPSAEGLRRFVQFDVDPDLNAEIGSGSLADMAYEFIEKAQARGLLGALVRALRDARPQDDRIAALASRVGLPDSRDPAVVLPRLQHFVGRDAERDALVTETLRESGAAICLQGPPGAGKSTLAVAVLDDARVAERFGVRRWFVRLDSATSADAVWADIRRAMGLPFGSVPRDAVLRGLVGGGALALDNFETPWDADSERVAGVLREVAAVRGVALMVTMRGRGALPQEVRWHRHDVDGLSRGASRELFASIAECSALVEGGPVDAALDELADLPLAVLLLAGLAREVGVQDALSSWRAKKTETLSVSNTTAEARHRSWLAVLRASFASPRLDDDARRMARWMAELPDGVAREDLRELAGDGATQTAARLVDVGLGFWDDRERRRLRMLPPVREGMKALTERNAADDARVMALYWRRAAEDGARVGRKGGAEAAKRMVADFGNVGVAIRRAAEEGDWERVASGARGIAEFVRFTGDGDEELLTELSGIVPDEKARAQILASCGDIALARSDHERARALFEDARPLFVKVGDVLGEADCIQSLGNIALERSDHERAQALFEDARPLFVKVGDVLGEANCILRLGDIARQKLRWMTARENYERSLALYQRIQEPYSIGCTHASLASVSLSPGARLRHIRAAIAEWEKIGRDDLIRDLKRSSAVSFLLLVLGALLLTYSAGSFIVSHFMR